MVINKVYCILGMRRRDVPTIHAMIHCSTHVVHSALGTGKQSNGK